MRILPGLAVLAALLIGPLAFGSTGEADTGWLDRLEPATRDRLDDGLIEPLSNLAPGEKAPIIVMMADQIDLEQVETDIVASRLDRQEREELVIGSLKSIAAQSQPALAAQIDVWTDSELVNDFRSLWLINAFTLTATKDVILEIASRADVGQVFYDSVLELDYPESEAPAEMQPGQAEVGLRAVGAPSLWGLGYSGAGTIVMNIDTGVDGDHPALVDRWYGNRPGVTSDAAWFDPIQVACTSPCDYGTHGTHTLGIMAGLDPATADTVGVAPGAEWIAAATIDVGAFPHTSYSLAAFQWAVEPVPGSETRPPADVISCSWRDSGVSHAGDCGPNGTYWQVIDNFEALGGAVVFSAGNSGPSSMSITRPKNRISSLVNVWATGNVDANQTGFPIRNSSSRGPSDCDGITPKPEAVAPGTNVRATVPNGYGFKTGTSMASPHVGGAIALLMEAFPWATGTEIKLALYATAMDLGTPGEDNTYGNGLIDCQAAYNFLAGAAAIRGEAQPVPPAGVKLDQNVPNPFNPSTSITYTLPAEAVVSLTVYNIKGQIVAKMVDSEPRAAGTFTASWDGTLATGERAPTGMYAFRLDAWPEGAAQPIVKVRKAVLLK